MTMTSGLSAAALVAFVAMSAIATTSANAYSPLIPSRLCDGAISRQACTEHYQYVRELRARVRRGDTSPAYMRGSDPRTNQAMQDAGGGGGGGGGGGR